MKSLVIGDNDSIAALTTIVDLRRSLDRGAGGADYLDYETEYETAVGVTDSAGIVGFRLYVLKPDTLYACVRDRVTLRWLRYTGERLTVVPRSEIEAAVEAERVNQILGLLKK